MTIREVLLGWRVEQEVLRFDVSVDEILPSQELESTSCRGYECDLQRGASQATYRVASESSAQQSRLAHLSWDGGSM